ncbi:hypothetical protein C1645_874378 [Glomus cerebriforme]|uniref:Uncharacterized protein n=1 Tax=Glomus cerebriforme TaxID=658196 RepID=A0A397T3P4_9GLOM|nr:hypothetical protein C1645_874378 [Glomus cerebriforme]
MDHHSTGFINNYSCNSNNIQQSNVTTQQEHSSSNINYNVEDANFSVIDDNVFQPPPNYSDQHPMSNENISSSLQPLCPTPTISPSYAPQYTDGHQTNNSIISSLDIPNFKILIIPTSSPMSLNLINNSLIYSLDIPGFKILVIPTSIQFQ